MAEPCFLTTYHPLVKTRAGQEAIRQHHLLPFIDGSCRREPDFESRFPSITAICRAGKFAPHRKVGDRIAYLTVKRKYPGDRESGRRLVAVLRVIQRFNSHKDAAAWYEKQYEPLPSNCFVDGNPPNSFEFTDGDAPKKIKDRIGVDIDFKDAVRLWDAFYRPRVGRWSVFLATEAEFVNLKDPRQLSDAQIKSTFDEKIPATRAGKRITCRQMDRLVQLATGGPV